MPDKMSTSKKILQAAFGCLSTRGYANVSMRNIADEAGVSLGQVTYYYKNKESLFIGVIHMLMNKYLSELGNKVKSAAEKQKLAVCVVFFKELIRDKPELLRLLIDFTAQAMWIPSFGKEVNKLFHAITSIIEKNLSTDNSLFQYSKKAIAQLAFGTLLGSSIQIVLDTDRDGAFEPLNMAEQLLSSRSG